MKPDQIDENADRKTVSNLKYIRYLSTDIHGAFQYAIVYVEILNADDEPSIFGAYYGYQDGGMYDGGFFIACPEEEQFDVLDYSSAEESADYHTLNSCMRILWHYIQGVDDDINNLALTNEGHQLLEHAEEVDGRKYYADKDFDEYSLGRVSDQWNMSLRFDW